MNYSSDTALDQWQPPTGAKIFTPPLDPLQRPLDGRRMRNRPQDASSEDGWRRQAVNVGSGRSRWP